MEGKQETHASYAMLQFSRVSGKNKSLFGSSIQHNDYIEMRVKPAKVERSLNTDWYFEQGLPYVEVAMSYSQFTEAITAMNQGSGVPVTVQSLNGKMVEQPDFNNKRMQFENEVKDRMATLENKLKKLTEDTEDILSNKKSLNKGDREVIVNQIKSLRQEVKSNIPFMMSMFNEQMDKTVQEAKGEIEAFTQNKINTLGLKKLEELKMLE
jgi:ElaB/YqjD/DUF883 family membrane-anchored ribosome-binding protein